MKQHKPKVRTQGRSIVTNGKFLPEVDGRSSDARRYRDLIHQHHADLGGDDILSEGQRALVRRAVCIQVELERLEQQFANDGGASATELDRYQRAASTLRRLFEALGIHRGRIARDVTPPDLSTYIANRNGNGHARVARTSRVKIIDHQEDEP